MACCVLGVWVGASLHTYPHPCGGGDLWWTRKSSCSAAKQLASKILTVSSWSISLGDGEFSVHKQVSRVSNWSAPDQDRAADLEREYAERMVRRASSASCSFQ